MKALLLCDPPSRINAQQALLHPYFADLDKKSLPAVGEEYVGLPIDKIPPDFTQLFNALINIDGSDLEGEGEEWMKGGEETLDKMLRMVPSTMLLGVSTHQVSAPHDRFAKEESMKSGTEKAQRSSDPKKPFAEPLPEKHDVNMSTA
ncbi:unnamed protein product [Taenia asiatica]|uniref:Protein kinase domain-containing protein n=1 Tax=Taenia asiatica TaxID=60517 RepID=A0A0R3VXX1_TAEAS|nr:unnamed protein product [Taenia asiatica]